MWMKLFERARTKFFAKERFPSDSDIDILPSKPRSSLSKWFCSPPLSSNNVAARCVQVQRSSSLKERRTLSVDELHRKQKKKKKKMRHTDVICLDSRRPKVSQTRFDRLSSSLINYNDPSAGKASHPLVSSRCSRGGDSGYSEESVATRRAWHRSCPHCHCERQSDPNSSTESSSISGRPPRIRESRSFHRPAQLVSSRSFSHIRPLPKSNPPPLPPNSTRIQRTLIDKRRRNLSCDSSLWTRVNRQTNNSSGDRKIAPASIFGELNLAAIEHDSLRRSFSSSSSSSSSRVKRSFVVGADDSNPSVLSSDIVLQSVAGKRLKCLGSSTFLVPKDDEGSIGLLTRHPINSFLSLKGLRETIL